MTISRRFLSIFDVTGNAEEQMRNISNGAAKMSAVTSRSATTIRTMGQELTKSANAGARSAQTSRNLAAENLKSTMIQRSLTKIWDANTLAMREQMNVRSEIAATPKTEPGRIYELVQLERQLKKVVIGTKNMASAGKLTSRGIANLANNFQSLNTLAPGVLSGFNEQARSLRGLSSRFGEVETRARAMSSASSAGISTLTKVQQAARLESKRFGDELQNTAARGNLTTASLRALERRAMSISQTAAPVLAKKMRDVSFAMRQMANDTQLAEMQSKNINRRFSFMEDVSANAAKGMRTVSAASQGLMLSMSLLDKNLQGVLFSLIFLQFSGALKTSLAFAGLALAAGIAFKAVTGFLKTRKEIKELGLALQVVTGSTKAFELVESRAKDIVKDFGLNVGDSGDLVKGLSTIMVELRRRGIEPTEDALRVFSAVFLEQRAIGKDLETSMQEAANSTLDFAKDMDKSAISVEDFERSFEELMRVGAESIRVLDDQVGLDMDAIMAKFEEAGGELTPLMRRAIDGAEGEWGRVPNFAQQFIQNAIKLSDEEMQNFKTPIDTTVTLFEDAFITKIPAAIQASIDILAEYIDLLDPQAGVQPPGWMGDSTQGGFIGPLRPILPEGHPDFIGPVRPIPPAPIEDIDPSTGLPFVPGTGGTSPDLPVIVNITGGNFNGSPSENGRAIGREVSRIIGRGTKTILSARVT